MNIFLPVLAGGSALLAWQSMQGGAAPASVPVPGKVPLAGSNSSMPVSQKMLMMANVGQIVTVGGKGQTSAISSTYSPSALLVGSGTATKDDLQIRQRLHELELKAEEEYNRLTSEAKKRAAAELNKGIQPSPGLTGDESFADAARKLGAALGSTVGVAACNAIPIPGVAIVAAHTACATLGAIIGGYLGGKLGEWATALYADVKAWADRNWDSIQGAAEDVGGAVENAYDSVKNFVGSLW